MNKPKRVMPTALCVVALAAICVVSLASSPQAGSVSAAGSSVVVGAQTAPYPLASLPEAWGSSQLAKKPVPAQGVVRRSNALVALPAPGLLSRMPEARVTVGLGRVDPAEELRHQAMYVVRAQAPGIVEYLYDQTGATRQGLPLVRLYDLNVLSDLAIGESAMARFAAGPFVIAGKQPGLPPLPPSDFPKPTAIQRLLGIMPVAPPPMDSATPAPRPQLAPQAPRPGLAKASGLTAQPEPTPSATPERNVKPASVREIAHLSGEMADLHDRTKDLNQTLSKLDDEIQGTQDKLADARDDAQARERLYNQGVLARNVYEAAQSRVASLQDELQGLQKKRSETAHARELALQRIGAAQEQMDQEMAAKSRESATLAARDQQPPLRAPLVVSPRPQEQATPTPQPRRVTTAPAPTPPSSAANWFPSPTQRPRPELAHLPRLAGRGLHVSPEIPAVPDGVKRLASPRWVEQAAPSDGLVVRQLAPNGAQVQAGTPLLEVANRQWARVYSDISQSDVSKFPKGAPVRVSFDSYPGVTLEGFINGIEPLKGAGLARVEMCVVARQGYCPEDTYASLEWLVLAAPLVEDDRPQAMQPAVEERTALQSGYAPVYDLLPIVPPEVGPAQEVVRRDKGNEFVGLMRLAEVDARTAAAQADPVQAKHLDILRKWRETFTAGMTTGIFGNLVLTYPRSNEISQAIEKMACADVSHEPDRCARTMREALGWGLGDAAMWMDRLPERGYRPRKDGLARPGDILVWPFTYGPRRSQHIGVAVSQAGKLMLLSNLGGTLGTTELQGGYVAFYKPAPPTAPAAKTAAKSPKPPVLAKKPVGSR